MKYVVTGGAGFIGSHIAEALLDEGEVHVIDDLSLGRRENVPKDAIFHHGSILDADLLANVFRGATHVYHQGALGSVPRSIEDPLRTHEVNATGTLRVLQAARAAGVEKVVFASSSSAYGDTPVLPKHEEMPLNPKSPYAVSKATGELYCRTFRDVYGLRTTALRYFNVYGPRQDPRGAYAAVIPRFLAAARRGAPLTIFGDGSQTRDFTFVADVVCANLLAARAPTADGEVINIGGGARTSLLRLAEHVLALTGSTSPIEHAAPRKGDVSHSLASLEKASRLLGYAPSVTLAEGLRRTVEARHEVPA